MVIHNEQEAIDLLCHAAATHATATEIGDYRLGDKVHKTIIAALKWLEASHQTHLLYALLASPEIGVRLWAATYLLLHKAPAAEVSLQRDANRRDIHGLTAETTLSEWRAGRLESLW